MTIQNKVLSSWFLCLSFGVVSSSSSQVTFVNRDVVDSFHVGKYGCSNDPSVCLNHSATCQPGGSCICDGGKPNFRNPILISDASSVIKKSDSYGCMESNLVLLGPDNSGCNFKSLQVIPYSHNESATQFPAGDSQKCSLRSTSVVSAKFPDKVSETELHWLNESYVDFTIINNVMKFKWKLSVPSLQGTLITFNLKCMDDQGKNIHVRKCLRAKIRGEWKKDNETVSTTASVKLIISTTSAGSTRPHENSTTLSNTNDTSSGSSSMTIIIIAVVVTVVLLIVLSVVVCILCKKKRRQRSSPDVENEIKNLTSPSPYADASKQNMGRVPEKPVNDYKNHQHSAPDIKRVEVNGDFYAVPDKSKEDNDEHDGLNYLDPSALTIEGKDNINVGNREPVERTQYADITGVLKNL